MTPTLVTPLCALTRHDLPLVGGKGANLGELVNQGFPVPDGFVVTTGAYAATVRGEGLDQCIAEQFGADPGADDGSAIRAGFAALTMGEPLRAAILAAYAELGAGAVAVRSSATAEDLPAAAFAGQQDTYLNVIGQEAVLDAVRRCWGSLWTDRAIVYRRRLGIDPAEVRIAVVVQKMVRAVTAGVLFTANPVTGDREQIVVDAGAGLGEAVVSGLVTPDHYVLDRGGRLREWRPGRGEVVIRATATGGVTSEIPTSTPAGPAGAPTRLMRDEELAELARLGRRVAHHFGRPQDIEWAATGDRVWLLQARPMTALPPTPVRLNRRQRLLGPVLLEYLPVRPYPLDMSTWVAHGPIKLMARVTRSVGIRSLEGFIEEQDGVVTAMVPPSPRPMPTILTAPARLIRRAWRYDPRRWTEDRRFLEFLRRVRELADRDLASLDWPHLVGVPREALDLTSPLAELRIDYLPRLGLAMLRLFVLLTLLGRRHLLGTLVGGVPTQTDATNRALEALADRVRDNPVLRSCFAELPPGEPPPADVLTVVESDPEFSAALSGFLREYGHRETTTPLLVTPPTWADAPEIVLSLVRVLAERPPPPRPVDQADEALRELLRHSLLRGPRTRVRVRRWVNVARHGLAFREDSHFHFTRPLPILRRALLEIGRRLCEAGVLSEPEQVFHLRLEELEAIADVERIATSQADRLRAAVRARSARRAELSGVPLISPAVVFSAGRRADGEALVTGTPASGGTATGYVCVIRESAAFAKLGTGDILVCPYTNPAWTPLFQRAAAVVVDSGSVGSHAAIVAREYGIPAVVGTAVGTTVLSDRQQVTVDGGSGRVTAAVDGRS